MTKLSDPAIADVARRAGFSGDDLVTAIACALAASGGIPAYEHRIDPGPVARYVGLWGLDTVQWPVEPARELTDPHRAGGRAYELTKETGGFHWCPAYRAGSHYAHLDRARVASSQMPGRETLTIPTPLDHRVPMIRGHLDRLGELGNSLQDLLHRKR